MNKTTEQDANTRNSNGSVERTLQLIQILATEGRAMTLAQLASQLSLPKSTVHRLCARLVEQRFLARDIDERRYTAGPALHRLAFDTLTHGTFSRLRHTVLSDLVDEVGETCNFTTLDGASILYLDRVEAERPWRLTLSVGVHVPLHCTASGKLFLSQMSVAERDLVTNKLELRAMTRNTITDVRLLMDNVESVRQLGYAMEIEEFVVGLIAVAVPVVDSDGRLRAAIAMHCPTTHVDVEQAKSKLPALRAAAKTMSELLDI